MAQYEYAMHDNNVAVREWCNKNRGRGSRLSEQLFSYMQNPKSGIAKYKCGEQLIDDEMFERAKVIMQEIENLENQGKIKIRGELESDGCSLSTNKKENYTEIENSKEYKDYVNFHRKYYYIADDIKTYCKLELPSRPKASNLMSALFKQRLKKAMLYVSNQGIEPDVKSSKNAIENDLNDKKRIVKIREASLKIKRADKVSQVSVTPKEEFEDIVQEISLDEKLSKLVPVILLVNFSSSNDFDQLDNIYQKFIDPKSNFSVLKLVNLKSSYNKALEMIEDGWLSD